ncbi:MAG TPA: formate dehydrogenase accessory sulfurtransferase FdhD [bacterium]|nr:formate dehydrogenase accessory sulfurtransferase FdhD [bacterium]
MTPAAEGMPEAALPAARTSTVRRRVVRAREDSAQTRTDVLAVEEPLEIRLYPPDDGPFTRISVTMRTPGHDFELAAGFLCTEGVVRTPDDIRAISYCTDPSLDGGQQYNIVNVALRPGAAYDPERLRRNFYTTSSCGVCGKASIEAIHVRGIGTVAGSGPTVDEELLVRIGDALRDAQTLFTKTGGLHAAGLFDQRGRLLALREDVGRHNAVDKLVGYAFLGRRLPLRDHIVMVSGRAGFEIVQKAAAAGVPVVAAVSAPSSLACDTAEAFGMTLLGFVRGPRFTVYTGAQRVRLRGAPPTEAGVGPSAAGVE